MVPVMCAVLAERDVSYDIGVTIAADRSERRTMAKTIEVTKMPTPCSAIPAPTTNWRFIAPSHGCPLRHSG
jgi:hypothetical protein